MGLLFFPQVVLFSSIKPYVTVRDVTKKKPDCINHALGTKPIGKSRGHRKIQLLSYVGLQFFCNKDIPFFCYKFLCNIEFVAFVTIWYFLSRLFAL